MTKIFHLHDMNSKIIFLHDKYDHLRDKLKANLRGKNTMFTCQLCRVKYFIFNINFIDEF